MSAAAARSLSLPPLVLPPPVNVSPLIRFCRWSLLIAGLAYGYHRHGVLVKKETKIKDYERKQKKIRDAKMAVEKARQNRDELIYLAEQTGVPIPPGF